MLIRPLCVAAVLLCVASTTLSTADAAEFIGAFGDWDAFTETGGGAKTCFMASAPKKAEGKYTKRGDPYSMVMHRPAEQSVGLVSIEAGYTYKEDSEVEVTIDGEKFRFYSHPNTPGTAWAYDDKSVLQAMVRGRAMVVRGTSLRGTLTTDTYSLSGVTRALKAISKACELQ